MAYYVRLLTPSDKAILCNEMSRQGLPVQLITGTGANWDRIEVNGQTGERIAVVEREPVAPGSTGAATLAELRRAIDGAYPVSARGWLQDYLNRVRTIYSFRIETDNVDRGDWPILGRVQNVLKDELGGIIQADNEGFYNEDGNYILWQMYEGAGGTIPAATLGEDGHWVSYQLKLEEKAIERFKEGLPPKRGWFGR